MKVQIVHISDLHFKNDVENRVRVQNLLTDLATFARDQKRYVAFTGDLVHSGDDDSYDLLFDQLIGPLVSSGAEVLVVPGNHDVQRSQGDEQRCNELLADKAGSYLFHKNGSINLGCPFAGRDPLQKYRRLEGILAPYDNQSYYGYLANRESISFVGLNTTWLSCIRQTGASDQNKLRVEPAVLDELVRGIPNGSLRVALMHHPIDWFEEAKRNIVSTKLVESFDLVLYGHVHTSDATNFTRDQSDCMFVQSPPLRAGWSRGNNGYSIITADIREKAYQIEYRSYSEPRRVFVKGEEFAPDGVRYPRDQDRAHFVAARSSSEGLLSRFEQAESFDYTDWFRSHIRSKSKTVAGFVVPKSARIQSDGSDTIIGTPQLVTSLISQSSSDQFYIAPLDSGSTTAAFLAFKHLSETFSVHRTIPIYFDAAREKVNRASILRAATQTCLGDFTHAEIEQLSASGNLTFVIDGLCLSDPDQFNLLRQTFAKHFPSLRVIVFANTDKIGASGEGASDLELSIELDEVYELAQMDVADIREMIQVQRSDLNADAVDVVVSQVVSSFRQMDEPIFASSVAVVLDTLRQDPEFKPINKARLIERYVECLLGRFDLEDVREGTFSSGDKIDLLSFAARKFMEAGSTSVDELTWNDILVNYERTYLLDLPTDLLQEFLSKGILTIENGRVTFRGDHMYTFFVARQMKADPDFAAGMIRDHGAFRYHREVVVYAELEGTNIKSVLDVVHNLLGEVETSILEAYSRVGVDLTTEWQSACAEGAPSGHGLDDAADKLNGTKPTRDDADHVDDADLAIIDRRRGVSQRSDVKEIEARFLVAMKLYSLLIKNGMQVPAADKLRHLTRLFEFAELWVGIMCARRDLIGRYPVVIAGGVRYLNPEAISNTERSISNFKYNAPNSISRILSSALGNPQLSPALRSLVLKLEPMQALFARDALLEISGQKNAESYLRSLAGTSDVVLATGSLRTLRSKYLGSSRSKERRTHFEYIVSEIGKIRTGNARVDIAALKKTRMVQDLRENAINKKQKPDS